MPSIPFLPVPLETVELEAWLDTVALAAGLAKTFTFGERVRMRFESTFINLPNHLNYAPPATDVTSPSTFGKLTSVQSAENAGNRTGQVALRVEF